MTDSEPLLDSLGSTKQVEQKMLRQTVQDMKDMLEDKSVDNYRWITTKKMAADALTKEKADMHDLMRIVEENRCEGINEEQKKVICKECEIKLTLRRDRK